MVNIYPPPYNHTGLGDFQGTLHAINPANTSQLLPVPQATSDIFLQSITVVKDFLGGLSSNPQINYIIGTAFGRDYKQDVADKILTDFAQGNFVGTPKIELVSGQSFNGAYAKENDTIYLSHEFVGSNSVKTVAEVLLEEFGHYIDGQINVLDAAGDEGSIFSQLVRGQSVSPGELVLLKSEKDHDFLVVDGLNVAIEKNVTFYEHGSFGGAQITYGSGNYELRNNWWNDKISSLSIQRGWVVEGYEHSNYGGGRVAWSSSQSYVGNNWNDKISSFRIYQIPNLPTIYEHDNFGGRTRTLNIGDYSYIGNDWNDRVTSITIPRGWVIEAYEHGNFNGQKAFWTDSNTYIGNNWNDKISSLKVYRTESLVNSLYQDILGRNPDSGGFQHYLNQLNNGVSYEQVRSDIGRSGEARGKVSSIYRDVLGREPDAGGLQHYLNQLSSNWSLTQVRSDIGRSGEARDKVNKAYQDILLRNADTGGLQYYVNNLATGWTLRQVYEHISSSQEARSNFWVAQYFNNVDRAGTPVFAQSFGRTNTGFSRNWGNGSPSNWVNNDNFSARIFGQVSFGAGQQEIRVQSDDGVRVRINGQTIIDRLVDQSFVLNTGIFNAGSGGRFNVEIEYYERGGGAALDFSTRHLAPHDNAGNTLGAARIISTLSTTNSTFSDWVGSADTNDYYRFSINDTRNLRLSLTGLSADVDVELLNGSGNVISSSTNSGTNSETINFDNLGAGTYYARVYPHGSANTNYTLSLRGEIPNWYKTTIGTTNGGEQRHVTFERVQGPGYIENKPTWLVIHGWDGQAGDFRDLAGAIEEYDGIRNGGDYQVLTVDWDAARTGKAALHGAAAWIDTVAGAIKNTIESWGIAASNINLVGHSLGAYVAYEVSERLGGINKLVALNPASNTVGGYDQSQVNFSRHSNWSWAFFHNHTFDHADISRTANESFKLDLSLATHVEGHGGAKILWTNMLKRGNGYEVSKYFGLEDMNGSNKPWYIDPENTNQRTEWEAEIVAIDDRAPGAGEPSWIPSGRNDA